MTTAVIAETICTTEQVYFHHLAALTEGIDSVLMDYNDDSVIITPHGKHTGCREIRTFFEAFLNSATPEFWEAFKVTFEVFHGDVVFITWSADPFVPIATDTLIVKNGVIAIQTVCLFGV